MKNQTITISPSTIIFAVLFVIGLFILLQLTPILIAFFVAFILMSALNPAVNWLEKQRIPRPLAILLCYTVVGFFLSLLFSIVVPPLARELTGLIRTLQIPNLPPELLQLKLSVSDLSSILSQFSSSITSVIGAVTSTFSTAFFLVTLIVMTFFLLLERYELVQKYIWTNNSARWEKLINESIDKLEVQLGNWVRGQFALMLIIAGITFLVLTILGVPYALPLAVLAGLLEILPNLGPTIAAVPAIIVAFLLVSPSMAGIVLIAYVVIQQLENNLIVPRIMKAAVNVEPLLSILLILAGASLAGVMGALLAIPTFLVSRTLFYLYLRETGKLKK